VDRLGRKGEEGALVRAILEVGKALGASVVAEGIETDAQLAALRTLGCALGQGYYFARPLEAARVEELVAGADGRAEAA
jgi:EAL domain-containing protein (putative c-di-GMP-specific phosphodiesterase class I)